MTTRARKAVAIVAIVIAALAVLGGVIAGMIVSDFSGNVTKVALSSLGI